MPYQYDLTKYIDIAPEDYIGIEIEKVVDYDKWMSVFERTGVDPAFYANRAFGLDEVLPWDIIDAGVTKEFLRRERDKAYEAKTTPSCAEHCNGCGANKLGGKTRWCN